MPRKNTEARDQLLPHHVYNRARKGRPMFVDDADRDKFLDLIACRLSRSTLRASRANRNADRVEGVELFAYCLMKTHFHLIVWQKENEALRRFMQSVLTSYVMYYNRRHNKSGPLFAGPFRARPITTRKDFRWAIAYVHDNHPTGPDYRYSSHRAFIDDSLRPAWLNAATPLKRFDSVSEYNDFLDKREERAALNTFFF